MTRSSIPTGNAVSDFVAAFFKANPNEELTLEDIMVKFNCSRSVARHAVSPSVGVRNGIVLERISVYRMKPAEPMP